MPTFNQLLEADQLGLIVYSPECAQSRLWGNLDHAIHEATGYEPVFRRWIIHDYNSVMRFYTGEADAIPQTDDPQAAARKYDDIPADELQYGHLVVKLLLMGPSLLTLWRGDDAVAELLTLKGATHPAEATKSSIRGRFWCDTAVSNLMHTSDSRAEAHRELISVGLDTVLDQVPAALPLIPPASLPEWVVPHCAVSVVADVVDRILVANGHIQNARARLPVSGDAKETYALFDAVLSSLASRYPSSPIAPFITSYFAGGMVAVSAGLQHLPVTRWEGFIIQCGAISQDKWHVTRTE
ncbi:MAG: nucleoside-diphosphate kinase [Chloroflexota bacterium]